MSHRWPQIVAGGEVLIFSNWIEPGTEEKSVSAQVLATGERHLLTRSTTAGWYLPSTHLRAAAVGMSSERLALLSEAVRREVAENRAPGAVVAIARRGQLVYNEAFGYLDKAAGTPMPKDAVFAVASMTKPVFSVAAMTLYEEGRLLMNEPVGRYLPRAGRSKGSS